MDGREGVLLFRIRIMLSLVKKRSDALRRSKGILWTTTIHAKAYSADDCTTRFEASSAYYYIGRP